MDNLYAVDGTCHNAEPGTYGHECGKPATWLGYTVTGWGAGFCDRCKDGGRDARNKVRWERCDQAVGLPDGPFSVTPRAARA